MINLLIIIVLSAIVLLLLALILIFLLFAFDAFLDLPYVATKREKIPTIIKLANIKKAEGPEGTRRRDVAIDLGSGDGRLLFAAAKSGAQAIGYEVNPLLVLFTRIKSYLLGYSSPSSSVIPATACRIKLQRWRKAGIHNRKILDRVENDKRKTRGSVTVHRKDLWQADLKAADVIFVYGRAKTMPRFEKFVYQNTKKGTRIIVNTDLTNPFPTKKPIKVENGIYLYKD